MAETKHGAWVHGRNEKHFVCSECGSERPFIKGRSFLAWYSNYCPECGAKMDLDASEFHTNLRLKNNCTIKTDCLLYDEEKGICRGLRMLYCSKEQCKFYKNGKEKPKKKRW